MLQPDSLQLEDAFKWTQTKRVTYASCLGEYGTFTFEADLHSNYYIMNYDKQILKTDDLQDAVEKYNELTRN